MQLYKTSAKLIAVQETVTNRKFLTTKGIVFLKNHCTMNVVIKNLLLN